MYGGVRGGLNSPYSIFLNLCGWIMGHQKIHTLDTWELGGGRYLRIFKKKGRRNMNNAEAP